MNHDMSRRFAFIEARLLWGGGLTANELGAAFGIARQNAQHTLDLYRQQHDGQMRYDRKLRRHLRTPGFSARHVREEVTRFLDYQRAVSQVARFHDEPDWADLPFADTEALVYPIYDQTAVGLLLESLRRETTVEIDYWSKQGQRCRCISPHHLVFADGRYHVRAYCHEAERHLDFVLSRVARAYPANSPWVSGDDDVDWHQRQNLVFAVNPALSADTQAALRMDYLTTGQERLKVLGVRKALAYYVRRRMLRTDHQLGAPAWIEVTEEDRPAAGATAAHGTP